MTTIFIFSLRFTMKDNINRKKTFVQLIKKLRFYLCKFGSIY